jgi:hypothetical protein
LNGIIGRADYEGVRLMVLETVIEMMLETVD